MNRSILTVITLVAAVAAAAPAAALNPIDDFEIGSFALWTSRNNNCVSDTMLLSWYEPHVISQVRIVTVCGIGDEPCTSRLTAGSQVDDAILFTAGGNPTDFLRINYNWGYPRTLTYGGVLNRIELDLKQGLPGGTIAIAIWDASGADYVVRDASAPGILTFPLSEFESVDVNAAMRIEVDIESSYEAGAFQVADIRLRGDGYWGPAQPVDFVGDFVAIDWPPLPSPPLSWRMTDPEGNWLYRTDLTITQADGGVINPCFHADWSEAAALGGEIGGVAFMGIDPQPFIDTNFELTVDLDTAIRLGPIPQIIGEPSLTTSQFGFLITFPVMLTDAAGNEIGRSETRILFDVHEGQPLTMENVTLAPGAGAMPGWTNGFVLAFTMDVIDVVDLEEPLFEATWIADWSPLSVTGIDAPDASGAAAPAPSDAIVLTAWPSVTRDAAEIRASLPFAADGSIEIHDVSGRLVRTLAAPSGSSSIRWDGRDARGQLTASGSFFAHLAGGSSRPTRIVRLR
jgi:FlgD Ig-like domain